MSWESIFKNIANIIQMITMIGPIIEFVETLFKRFFPGKKMGEEKKHLVLRLLGIAVDKSVPDDLLGDMVDGMVAEKNRTGEFTHTETEADLQTKRP